MAYVSKDKTILEKARGEYIASSLSIKEVAELNGLKAENFRLYLKKTNAIKPEHINKSKAKVQNALNAIKAVENAEIVLPAHTAEIIRDFKSEIEGVKGDMLKVGDLIIQGLIKSIESIDPHDLKESLMYERYANTLKLLNDTLGIFAKAPNIAIQNNLQQNIQNERARGENDNKITFELKKIDNNSQE